MSTARKAAAGNRITKIKDPAQRAVAKRIGEICDWFSADIVKDPPAERLVVGGKAGPGENARRVRNLVRKFAAGAVVALCEDLGVPLRGRHGHPPKGHTEIEELRPLHPATTIQFLALFRALLLDRGDFGKLVAEKYARVVREAQAEVRAATDGRGAA